MTKTCSTLTKKATAKKASPEKARGGPTVEMKLLSAIKQATVLFKTDELDRKKVAALAGCYTCNSTVRNAFAKLKTKGLVEYVGKNAIRLTEKGHEQAGSVSLPTNEESIESIKAILKGPKPVQILEILSDGHWHSRKELAALIDVDITKSTFRNAMGSLRTKGLVEEKKELSGDVMVRLIDTAFPQGRPNGESMFPWSKRY